MLFHDCEGQASSDGRAGGRDKGANGPPRCGTWNWIRLSLATGLIPPGRIPPLPPCTVKKEGKNEMKIIHKKMEEKETGCELVFNYPGLGLHKRACNAVSSTRWAWPSSLLGVNRIRQIQMQQSMGRVSRSGTTFKWPLTGRLSGRSHVAP